MKYLCLVYLDRDNWSATPDDECAAYGKSLRNDAALYRKVRQAADRQLGLVQ